MGMRRKGKWIMKIVYLPLERLTRRPRQVDREVATDVVDEFCRTTETRTEQIS